MEERARELFKRCWILKASHWLLKRSWKQPWHLPRQIAANLNKRKKEVSFRPFPLSSVKGMHRMQANVDAPRELHCV